jgi:hypothetical protein
MLISERGLSYARPGCRDIKPFGNLSRLAVVKSPLPSLTPTLGAVPDSQ